MKLTIALVSLAAASALSLRCASAPPPREIANARLAIEDARNAGADRVAPRDYDAANAHLNVAQATWDRTKDPAATAQWARIAEGEARTAQYRAEAQKAEEDLRRQAERRSRGELAVRDAEIALLQARAKTDAEKRAAEAEARAAAERRQVQEELARREAAAAESARARSDMEAKIAAEQAQVDAENAQRTEQERQRLNSELDRMKAELETTRKTAEEAKKAADEQQQRLEEQRRADEARQAEIDKAREGQQQSEEQLRQTLAQLAQVRQEARGLIVTLPGNIYFDVNKSDVKPAMRDRLTEIGRALASVPDRRVLIEGHTDSDGAAAYNLELSRLRAQSVRSVLVAGGVPPDRIETNGYGKTRPVASNANTAGKAQNRRVEIVLEGGVVKAPAQ